MPSFIEYFQRNPSTGRWGPEPAPSIFAPPAAPASMIPLDESGPIMQAEARRRAAATPARREPPGFLDYFRWNEAAGRYGPEPEPSIFATQATSPPPVIPESSPLTQAGNRTPNPVEVPGLDAAPSVLAAISQTPPGPSGVVVNNAGTLSDARGVTGFAPIQNTVMTPDDRGLAAMGYGRSLDGNSLRRLSGDPAIEQQMNLMRELGGMVRQSAPGVNALDTATRLQQQQARDNYIAGQTGNLMQQFMPGVTQNQLGSGRLNLERDVQFGTGGVPGAMQNAASDALNRTRESDRYGPAAQYAAYYNQRASRFPPGTPHNAIVEQLRQEGLEEPAFLANQGVDPARQAQAGGRPSSGPAAQRRAATPDLAGVEQAFSLATSAFPMDQAGRRQLPSDPAAVSSAITNVMSRLSDEHLRDPAVRNRLVQQFTDRNLDSWLNTTGSLFNSMSMEGQNQQRQIRRFLNLAGMRQQPITPFTTGASPLGRAFVPNWINAAFHRLSE